MICTDRMNPLFLTLPRASHSTDDSSSSVEIDSDIEITSLPDDEENEVIRLGDCLRLTSDESEDDSPTSHRTANSISVNAQSSRNDETADLDCSSERFSSTVFLQENEVGDVSSPKRKRRAWSVNEKLHAIETYERSSSKHFTAKAIGCTRFQLSQWIKKREDLRKLQASKRGESMRSENSAFSRSNEDCFVK